MNRNTLVLCVVLFCTHAFSQEFPGIENLMTKRALNCTDIYLNCTELIPRYFMADRLDSAKLILNYWNNECGKIEAVQRLYILLALHESDFTEAVYDTEIIRFLLRYYFRSNARKQDTSGVAVSNYWHRMRRANDDFDEFTIYLAHQAAKRQEPSTAGYWLSRFYSDTTEGMFARLKSPEYAATDLSEYYNQTVRNIAGEPDGHLSVFAGLWRPLGSNQVLGNHPSLGFTIGRKWDRWLVDGALEFRFVNAPHTYSVGKDGVLYNTKHFFGGFIGVEGGRELLRTSHNELDLIAGLGYDGFDALKKEDGHDAKSINSLNLNAGIGYRYYFSPFDVTYMGVQVRYNLVRYTSSGGTDLSGNTLTLRLIFGWSGNVEKNRALEALGYEY